MIVDTSGSLCLTSRMCTSLTFFPHSLKTQMAYVQHEESELEKKRLHCMWSILSRLNSLLIYFTDIKVVDAFKSALELLTS